MRSIRNQLARRKRKEPKRLFEDTDNSAASYAEIIGVQDPAISVPSTGSRNYFDVGLGYRLTDNNEHTAADTVMD